MWEWRERYLYEDYTRHLIYKKHERLAFEVGECDLSQGMGIWIGLDRFWRCFVVEAHNVCPFDGAITLLKYMGFVLSQDM